MENTQQERRSGSAIESFRNEVIKSNKENQDLYISAINNGIVPAIISSPINFLEEEKKE